MNKKGIIVEKDKKLVQILQDFGFSFADVCKMMRNKDVKIDGKVTKENVVARAGQTITIFFSDTMLEKKFEKIFEDENVVIAYKFAGIETDGEKGLSKVLGAIAVHRLDRNTEGLVIFARNEKTANLLKKALKNHKIHKFYVAEVVGKMNVDKQFDAFLLKDSEKAEVKIFDKQVKGALPISTKIKTLKAGNESSFVEVELLTGRTHQIRAHLSHLGHAIIGDGKYGKNDDNKKFHENRQKLACFCLKFDFVGIESLDFKEFRKMPKWVSQSKV